MTTKTRLFALAAATFTASLVAGTASASHPIPSANAINKVHTLSTLSTHVPFVVRPTNPGGNGRKDNNGSDNSTVRN